jgi:hypothetical protein
MRARLSFWRHPRAGGGPSTCVDVGRWMPAFGGMTILFLILSWPILASDLSTKQPAVDPALCRALVKHTPDADVTYQPGVDVQGNPVAPADLPGQPQMQLPDKIQIPLTISLVQALHLSTSTLPGSELGAGTEATIGMITVEGDKVFLNGQPISDTQQDNLAVLCMQPNGTGP